MNSTLNVVTGAPVATVAAMAGPRICAINAGLEAKPAAAATAEMPEAMADDDRSPTGRIGTAAPAISLKPASFKKNSSRSLLSPINGATSRRDLGLNNVVQSYSINAGSGPVFRDPAPWEG